MMITFVYSAWTSDRIWKTVNDFYLQKKKFNETDAYDSAEVASVKQPADDLLYDGKIVLLRLRIAAIVTFMVGVASLAYFVGASINKEKGNASSVEVAKETKSTLTIRVDSARTITHDTVLKSRE